MPDFGFVGACYQTASITQDDQECINWYPEIDPAKGEGERGVVALYPTPGFFAKINVFSQVPIRAMWVIPGGQYMYMVAGSKVWKINSSMLGSIVGTLATTSGNCSMTDNGTSLYLCDGGSRYSVDLTTDAFAVVADGAFTGANRVDQIDNYIIYNKPNSNTWAATNLGSTVTSALSFGRKDSASDNIVTLIVNKREIFILGERTSEVWIDAGLFPFPFQKLPGTNMQHGCQAPLSVALFGESFAFLGKDDRGTTNVYHMDGYIAREISTQAMQAELATYPTLNDAIGLSYQQNGHEFYMITFPTADKTWCYDRSTKLWHRRATRDSNNVYHRDKAISVCLFQGFNLFGDKENGIVYQASLDTFTDYSDPDNNDTGNPIPRVRRCRHLTSDLNNVFYHDFQIQFQPGVGLPTGQGQDPVAMLRWSDDGGFTWSNEHWASIGKTGAYKNRTRWQQLGMARDRIFEVVVTDPVFAVVVSANLRSSAGES